MPGNCSVSNFFKKKSGALFFLESCVFLICIYPYFLAQTKQDIPGGQDRSP